MTAPDRLPHRLRDCVDQTIAAEALEGWLPTAEEVDALVALVNGDVSFDDYLAASRSRYQFQPAQESARRRLRREAPYLIPRTSVLNNNFGADSHETLADLEFVATAGRIAGWHRRLADGQVGVDDLDIPEIHRQLFADVYAWAGSYRVTDLRLGDDVFASRSSVQRLMARVEAGARALVADDAGNRDDALARQLARFYAEYNYVHPFREGNGRTGTLVLHIVSTLRGRRLDLGTISRDEWYSASRDSMPLRRDGRADPRSFVPLLLRALG
ncbi:MAG: cell filamentation protein [Mycobacterium sp.]|nr:cell filamentation protein [Mycobacterium sp.]